MAPARILIVEDEVVLAKGLARDMERAGYEVVGRVTTGEEAIHIARETQPDLVLMDIELQGEMDGIEASVLIRSCLDAAVIYLTAHTSTDVFERAKDTEPYAYLTKPVSLHELGRTVEMALYKLQIDKKLRESERRLSKVVESISDGFIVLGDDLVVNYFNRAAEDLLGRKREDVIGRPLFEAFPEGKGSIFEEKYTEALRQRSSLVFETFFGMEPYENWYDVRVFPYEDGISVYFQVTTERKIAELALAAEKERLSVTLRCIGDGVISTDTNGIILSLNKVAEELTGCDEQVAVGRPIKEVFHIINRSTRQRCDNPIEKVLETGNLMGPDNHTILIGKDGKERTLADTAAPIFGKDGNIIGAVLVFRDVTEEK